MRKAFTIGGGEWRGSMTRLVLVLGGMGGAYRWFEIVWERLLRWPGDVPVRGVDYGSSAIWRIEPAWS